MATLSDLLTALHTARDCLDGYLMSIEMAALAHGLRVDPAVEEAHAVLIGYLDDLEGQLLDRTLDLKGE